MTTMRSTVSKNRLLNHKSKRKKHRNHKTPEYRLHRPVCGFVIDESELRSKDSGKESILTSHNKKDIDSHCDLQNNGNHCKKHAGPRYTFSTEIPDRYDDVYLCALPRDPQWLYVYWEYPDGTNGPPGKFVDNQSEIAKWILRVKAISASNQKQYDIPINSSDTNWYVKTPEPGDHCIIEFGHVASNGIFTPISTTSTFSIPSPTIKNESQEKNTAVNSLDLINYSLSKLPFEQVSNPDDPHTITPNRSTIASSEYLSKQNYSEI